MIALCQLPRRFASRYRNCPNGSVITFFLFVDRHAHKCNARAVRRYLRITDPDKIPKIFFSDGALLREEWSDAKREENDEARMTNDEGMTKHETRQQMVSAFGHLIIQN